MKKKIAYTSILALTLVGPLSLPKTIQHVQADERKQPVLVTKSTSSKFEKKFHGLQGVYFENSDFTSPVLLTLQKNSAFIINKDEKNKLLSDEKQSVQSVRWKGSIQPSESGTYQFITSDNQQVQLKINEHSMIDYGDIRDGIPLKKGETYHIQIDYVPTTTDDATDFPSLQVFWKKDGGKQEEIPEQNLLRPNEETKQTRKKRDTSDTEQHEVKDTDNDNIFDIWEEEGYTIQNKLAVKWDENIHAKAGYTKYVSNPLSAHTSGDPYTDWEKVADDMDRSIKKEARDPLVAAYPVIGVGMEKMILSTNAISSSEAGRSVSVATSSSSTASNTLGMDVSAGYSMLQGFNAQITAQYAHTSSSTATTENTTGQTIGDSLQLNAGESAFLNANVRYYNTGTAPMYNVQPTTELVLGADTLSTIQAQANQIGDSLSPGETYPKKGVAPLALNTMDQFSSKLIPINFEQLSRIDMGEKLKLQTTQVSGNFGKTDASGNITTNGNLWRDHIPEIEAITSALILDTGNEVLERRVAAKDMQDPEDKTPILTIGEAIQKAFHANTQNGTLFYTSAESGSVPLDEQSVSLIYDEITAQKISQQIEKSGFKNIYDVKLERGMNIFIKKPVYSGKDLKNINTLKPYTTYMLGAYVKKNGETKQVQFQVGENQKSNEFTLTDQYQYITWQFTTGKNVDNYKDIQVKGDFPDFNRVMLTEIETRAPIMTASGQVSGNSPTPGLTNNGYWVRELDVIPGKSYFLLYNKDNALGLTITDGDSDEYLLYRERNVHVGETKEMVRFIP
ncbi:hypothetical protein CN345_24555, partial [Bacillus thuringiensis]